jgi:hypothetical protein
MIDKILNPFVLAALGGVIVIVATYWSSVNKQNTDTEIISLQRQLQEKTEKINVLTQQQLDMITGGDSYPILSPEFDISGNFVQFTVFNEGKSPLYDVTVEIVELDKNDFPKYIKIGDIGIGRARENVYKVIIPDNIVEKKLLAVTTARNGATRQNIKVFRSSGSLGARNTVYRNGKIIKEE